MLVYCPMIFAHCNSGIRQVVLDFFVLIDEHRIYGRKEHHMPPFLCLFRLESIQTG